MFYKNDRKNKGWKPRKNETLKKCINLFIFNITKYKLQIKNIAMKMLLADVQIEKETSKI